MRHICSNISARYSRGLPQRLMCAIYVYIHVREPLSTRATEEVLYWAEMFGQMCA